MKDEWEDDLERELRGFRPAALPPSVRENIALRLEPQSLRVGPRPMFLRFAAAACLALLAAAGTLWLVPEARFRQEVSTTVALPLPNLNTYRNARTIEELNALLDLHAAELLPGMDAAAARLAKW